MTGSADSGCKLWTRAAGFFVTLFLISTHVHLQRGQGSLSAAGKEALGQQENLYIFAQGHFRRADVDLGISWSEIIVKSSPRVTTFSLPSRQTAGFGDIEVEFDKG